MFIITVDYSKKNTWHTYVTKSKINAFHGYCMIYATHYDNRMILTKKQVYDAINLYHDEPKTQQAMKKGITKIK